MRSETPRPALQDIRDHIDLAVRLTQGFDPASFAADVRTVYAVTRCLEIISEASRRLPAALKERHPAIPWREIAAAGNVYRHDYEAVLPQLVWDTIVLALPALRDAVERELASP